MASASFQLAIKGWTTSKLSTTKDQGLESLLGFLEKKSSRKIHAHRLAGRTVLLITINEHDKDRFYHLNGFTWAGATLVVEDARPPRNQQIQTQSQSLEGRISQPTRNGTQNGGSSRPPPSGPRGQQVQSAEDARRMLHAEYASGLKHYNNYRKENGLVGEAEALIISVIRKRYHAGDKHLILNALVADPELLNSGLSQLEASKVYKAIFVICQTKVWETEAKRKEAVVSVSFRDNGITSVQDIISLSSVFPHIHNLDLANNNLQDLDALKFWKNQFRSLEHLILSGNPVALKPDTLPTLIKWYPNLKMYNNEPVVVAQSQSQPQPQPQPIGAMAAPAPLHPEIPPGSTFGVAQPDKPAEVLLREQMGLQFSFETRLKLQWVENCLSANNWDYALAMANFSDLKAKGQIPQDAFLEGV